MKKIMSAILVMALSLGFTGCGSEKVPSTSNNSAYQKISPSKAKEMIENDSDIVILDVRTPDEFAEKRIPDSILIPDYEISEKAEETLKDKAATILVYCRSGNRSKSAAKALIEMGYTNVYDFGGIIDWQYETISG